jgi:hypothetical protein
MLDAKLTTTTQVACLHVGLALLCCASNIRRGAAVKSPAITTAFSRAALVREVAPASGDRGQRWPAIGGQHLVKEPTELGGAQRDSCDIANHL